MKDLKFLPVEFDAKDVKDDGTFAGYASTFGNVDQGYDVVMPGAFANSLKERPCSKIKMLWQHDTREPIGVWTQAKEDDKGLYVEGRILKAVQRGAECYELMKAGVIDSMSIGFKKMESDYTSSGVRQLKELGLMEISLVTFPMNDQATVTAVKGASEDLVRAIKWLRKAIKLHQGHMSGSVATSDASQQEMMDQMQNAYDLLTDMPNAMKEFNPRELELSLRDAGFSRSDAVKAVALFRKAQRDAALNPAIDLRDADPEAVAAFAAQLRKFEASLRA